MEGKPRPLDGVEVLTLTDEMVLYLPGQELVVSLNPSAAAVWELCDGQTNVAGISQELGRVLGRPGQELLAEVEAAVGQLVDLGLVEII